MLQLLRKHNHKNIMIGGSLEQLIVWLQQRKQWRIQLINMKIMQNQSYEIYSELQNNNFGLRKKRRCPEEHRLCH